MKSVYLAGNVTKTKPGETAERFVDVKEALEKLGCKVYNPMRNRPIPPPTYEPGEIVDRDLWDIDRSDFVFALENYPSIGTSMEIMYARMVRRIPVIVVSRSAQVRNHYWIQRLATKVVESVEEGLKFVEEWMLDD